MNRRGEILIASTLLTGLGTIVVFLRMLSRGVLMNQLGKDDWVMFAAWCFTIIYLGVIGLSTRYGTGLPAPEQKPEWLQPALKCVLAIEILYYIIVYLIKCSILLFYIRLARNVFDIFGKATRYTMVLLTVFLCVCMVVVLTQCRPIEGNWNLFLPERKCINTTAFFYSTSVFNIVTDFWILCLPVKVLWGVQRPTMEKVALVAVFAMGIFACVASCVRLRTIQIFTKSKDPLYDAIPINVWSMIEINIAIICASVPALKALFKPQARKSSTVNSGGQYDIGSRTQGQPGTNHSGQNSASRAFALRGIKQSKFPASTTISSTVAGRESEERITGPGSSTNSQTPSEENIFNFGYGVGITSSKESTSAVQQVPARDYIQTVTSSPTRPGFEIGYQREVEVKIERRSTIAGQSSLNKSRDIDAEEGHRYGARPGRRPGAPPEWNGGTRAHEV